jgi:hypothetical protein
MIRQEKRTLGVAIVGENCHKRKEATDFSVTPWFCRWAMKDSNLQPPDEEIPSVV